MVRQLSIALLTVAVAAANIQARNIRLYNACPFTVWGAWFTGGDPNDPNYANRPQPSGPSGKQLDSYQSWDIPAPDNWNSGRIWARTECDFSKPDVQACATGSCIGGLECTDGGIPPVTVAEFTLFPPNGGNIDNYDVSNVDGSNLPMTITADGCETASCPVDLNANCPEPLRLLDSAGNTVGCKSACLALGGDSNCCTGPKAGGPDVCPESGVQYYDYFHGNCPNAYAYAYDEHNGVLKTCGNQADYTITLCPPPA